MAQLLVRDLDESLVIKLKRRAREHGISTEEEHRRILREALLKPDPRKASLIEFLLSEEAAIEPEVELDLSRSRAIETRDLEF
jgi:plasmid stability protein